MRYIFDEWSLDTLRHELYRAGHAHRLRRKAFQVLAYLLAHADRVVSKAELCAQVWSQRFISDTTLESTIKAIRQALGDSGRDQRLIQTVYGQGYRFVAAVTTADPAPLAPAKAPTPPHGREPREPPARRAPVVGRAAELAQLSRWWERAQGGARQLVFVTGEPGIGKTTLLDTWLAGLADESSPWIGHGQCIDAYGAGEPYQPVLEALGRLCRSPQGPRLVAVLRQYAPSWLAQLPALLPPAAWAALQGTVGPAAPQRMRRELTDALDAFTAECPLVLVLEDLHWSDRATLAWLAYVARRPDPARLLLLGTYRPGDAMGHDHPVWAVVTELLQHGQCVELALDGLSESAITAYLDARCGGTPFAPALARVLHRRTHGNPLFLSAVVDELIRQQVLHHAPTEWILRGELATVSTLVPATLRPLIEHQLARCSPKAQLVLEAASVAGLEFPAAAVAAGLARAEDDMEAQCATLAHHGQFLEARGSTTWPDGTVTACYGFRHALYRDVVYQRVPAGRRTRWHARMGTRLAQGFGEGAGTMAAAVARHCVQGRLWSLAVPYLRQAGQQAAGRGAYRDAVAFYEQALQALQQLPETRAVQAQALELHLDLRHALWPLHAPRRILEHLRQAEVLAETLGDQRRLGDIAGYRVLCWRDLGEPDASLASAQRALAIATARRDVRQQVAANIYLGDVYLTTLSDYPRAAAVFRRNLALLQATPPERPGPAFLPAVTSRAYLAMCLAELGAFPEGHTHGAEAVRLAEAVGHPYSLAQACAAMGYLFVRQGALSQALPALERGRALSEALEFPLLTRLCTARLGVAYTLAGRLDEALPLLERAHEETLAVRRHPVYPLLTVRLAEAYVRAGREAEAQRLGQQALEAAQRQQQQGYQAYALRLLGESTARHEPLPGKRAESFYRQALTLAEALGMRPLQAHCHHGLGTLYAKTGQWEQARRALSTAIHLYRAMEMTFWLPAAEAALAQVERR
jgi:DNA-binding winged helix-turn-helix (wHTH) protein/tetratricopeptide (TPR) repeat protein